jgi:hypothetical protein
MMQAGDGGQHRPDYRFLIPGVVFLSVLFLYLAIPVWTPFFNLGRDQDNPLLMGLLFARDLQWPDHGPFVIPTPLHLGPFFPTLVGIGLLISGGELFGAWVFLVCVVLAGVIAAVFMMARFLGTHLGLLFGAALVSMPLLYQEFRFPFWHQHYHFGWLAVFAAALVALGRSGAPRWWFLACAVLPIAMQLHATTWPLVVPLLLIGIVHRGAIGNRAFLAGILLLVLLAMPLVVQVGRLFEPGTWVAMFTSHGDPAEHNRSASMILSQHIGILSRQSLPGTITLVLAPLLAAIRLVPGRHRKWVGEPLSVEVLLLAWSLLGSAMVLALVHRWHDHYDLFFLVPIALGVVVLVDSAAHLLRALSGWRFSGAWIPSGAAAIVLLNVHGVSFNVSHDFHRPVMGPERLAEIVEKVCKEVGFEALDSWEPFGRVHGFLCVLPHDAPCASAFHIERARNQDCAEAFSGDVLVRFDAQEKVVVERRYERFRPGPDPRTLDLEAPVESEPGWFHLVTLARGPGKCSKPLVLQGEAEVAVVRVGIPLHDGPICVFRSSDRVAVQSGRWRFQPNAGDTMIDAFIAPVPMDAAALGMYPAGTPPDPGMGLEDLSSAIPAR